MSERDRKKGEGGNDEGRARERQLIKEEEDEEMESRRLKKTKRAKEGERKGGIRRGFS